MSAGFDNTQFVSSGSAITLTTPSFTISGTNRAAFVGLVLGSGSTGLTSACGGVSGVAISGADSGAAQAARAIAWGVIAPASGSQTATASWTTASGCTLGVVTASQVNQTTPLNNGNTANAGSGNPSMTITSANGDLTVETTGVASGTLTACQQTSRWNDTTTAFGAGSTGPGTGNTTHGWTNSTGVWAMAGANFVASEPAGSGGGVMDDRWRFRPSVNLSYTAGQGTRRSAWPEDSGDISRRDQVADNRSRFM